MTYAFKINPIATIKSNNSYTLAVTSEMYRLNSDQPCVHWSRGWRLKSISSLGMVTIPYIFSTGSLLTMVTEYFLRSIARKVATSM